MMIFLKLCLYEWKKMWGHKASVFLLATVSIFMILMLVLPYTGDGYAYRYHAEDGTVERFPVPYLEMEKNRKSYLLEYSGQLFDDGLIRQLALNYADSTLGTSQWNLNTYAPFRYLNTLEEPIAASAEDYYDTGNRMRALKEKGLSEQKLLFWEQRLNLQGLIQLDYCGGWIAVVKSSGILSVLTTLAIGIGLSSVFSEEHKKRTDQLILSSKNGRGIFFAAKLSASVSYAVLISTALYMEQLVIYGLLFGLSGFSAPLRLWAEGGYLWGCSIGQFSAILFAFLLISSIMLAAIELFVSELFQSAVPAAVVPFLFAAVPLMGMYKPVNRTLEQIINYLPTIRVSPATLEDYHLLQIGNTFVDCLQVSPVLYFLLAVLFLLLCWKHYQNFQITGR